MKERNRNMSSAALLKKEYAEVLERSLGREEARILIEFVNSRKLRGYFYTRVPIRGGRFRIDVVCVKGEEPKYPISVYGKMQGLRQNLLKLREVRACVMEIKKRINFEAVGQIMVDKIFFPLDYPNIGVEEYAILSRGKDEGLEEACKYSGIQTYYV
jgi:hypothetical protein